MEACFWKFILAAQLLCCAAKSAPASELNVFAAASLADVLKEIAGNYEKTTGHKLIFNFGASSFLARQIEEGAPADLFFSADEAKMDALQKKGLIVPGTRRSLLSNTLVIVVAKNNPPPIHSPKDLSESSVGKIALADPAAVPAGIYAKKYLEQLKLWERIAPKVVPTDNVRAALAAVESGNVDAGIVYKTDAAASKNVRVACEVPREDGPDITYPVAVIKESKRPTLGTNLLEYFCSAEAGRVFVRHGFILRK